MERQLVGQSYLKRTVVGFLIGAVAMGPIGYATGPSLGYGKIQACVEVSATQLCTVSLSQEEAEVLQRAQDQRRGAFFFSLMGGSVGAIVARRLANEWLVIQPPTSIGGDAPWSVALRVPLPARE